MRKFFSLIAAVLFAGSMMAADATMAAGTNGSACTVNGVDGIKCGTSKAGGDMTITVGAGATKLSFYAAAWKGVTGLSLNLAADGVTISPASVSLTADAGISNNSPFTLAGSAEAFKFEVDLTDVSAETTIAVTSSAAKRFVVWGATYTAGDGPAEPVIEYYVVGSMNNWELSADYKLAANPAQAGEYMKRFTFAANDELKVRKAIDGELDAWYPEGVGNNWVITEDGQYDVYFRPEGNTEWANGFFFVAPYVIPQYEVAEAIAAGLTDGTEIKVRGVVSKIEFKGTNFKTFGSANIYVNDATGAEGSFEFYNCYSMNADTFKVSVPAWDATSTSYAQFTEVSDANGYTIHVGDTVIAQGKYLYYAKNSVHELNTGCFIIYAKEPDAEFPTAIDNTNVDAKAVKIVRDGQLFIKKGDVLYNALGAIVK